VLVNDRRLLALAPADLDRQADEMDIVVLPPRVLRTEAPHAAFARLGRLDAAAAVLVLVNHLEPRRAIVVRREHDALAEMRPQMRPRYLSGGRFEENRLPFPWRLGFIFGIGVG